MSLSSFARTLFLGASALAGAAGSLQANDQLCAVVIQKQGLDHEYPHLKAGTLQAQNKTTGSNIGCVTIFNGNVTAGVYVGPSTAVRYNLNTPEGDRSFRNIERTLAALDRVETVQDLEKVERPAQVMILKGAQRAFVRVAHVGFEFEILKGAKNEKKDMISPRQTYDLTNQQASDQYTAAISTANQRNGNNRGFGWFFRGY